MENLLTYDEFKEINEFNKELAADKLSRMQSKDSAISAYQKAMGNKYPEGSIEDPKKRLLARWGMKIPSFPGTKRSYAKHLAKMSGLSKRIEGAVDSTPDY